MQKKLKVTLITVFISLLCSPVMAQAPIAEAVAGAPFGIGRLTMRISAADAEAVQSGAATLSELGGRVLYPAFSSGAVKQLLSNILGGDINIGPTNLTVLFLFRGDAPLQLSLQAAQSYAVQVVPVLDQPVVRNQLLQQWWREYNTAAQDQMQSGDYPPVVETYLTSMLGQRLGLPPQLPALSENRSRTELQQLFDLLAGTERMRQLTMRSTMLSRGTNGQTADRPLPEDIPWETATVTGVVPAPVIEPIASRIPPECFYVRFGSFANYLWLNNFLDEFGGDMSRMVQLRGHDAQLNRRMQRQLALKQSALAELFGPHVIADVVLLGRDFYLREGAALGVMFQASNATVLSGDIQRQRSEALEKFAHRGAKLEKVNIAGREVSWLTTPDNHLRSFYAVDGPYHLVTTSRRIVERFFEVADGAPALGTSTEFHQARLTVPLEREDTVFVYLSSAFLRGLLSPHYQIELARRIESVTDMELAQLARLAAEAEGLPGRTVTDLISSDLLPELFGQRPDGSGPILTDDGVIDSRRGARGSFIPIPDVSIRNVTGDEEARQLARAALIGSWKTLDPLVVGIKRFALDNTNHERVVIDGNISPLDERKYGWLLSLLGPPSTMRITPAPGDMIHVQMSVRGGLLLPSIPPHHLFLAVQDLSPPLMNLKKSGFFEVLRVLRTTPGYLGAWPKAGFLDLLPIGILRSAPDAYGFSRLLMGVWRREFDAFSVLSFDARLLADVTPHLRPVATESPAQIRALVGDLSGSRLKPWVTALNYQRAKQTSVGNIRLLHALSQQLGVPRPRALETAQKLLDVELCCSVGGQYELASDGWRSTRLLDPGAPNIPEDYQAPLLQWFRGLDLALTKLDGQMMLHAHVDMVRKPAESSLALPLFSLFGGRKAKSAKDESGELAPSVGTGHNLREF